MTKRFYTYEYLRSDWTPYYVGKGKGNRAFSRHRFTSAPKNPARIRIQYWADEAEAFEMEKWYIRFWGRKDNGTGILRNLTDGGEGLTGLILSEEHRRKIGEAQRGRKHSEETRRKRSEALRGRVFSEETLLKMREAQLGKKFSEERRRKNVRTWSEESRRKLSAANRGRKISEEHIRKTAEGNRGQKRSEEQRSRMSQANRDAWVRRRAGSQDHSNR